MQILLMMLRMLGLLLERLSVKPAPIKIDGLQICNIKGITL